MFKLFPTKRSEPGLIKAVGCLASVPVTIILAIALIAIVAWFSRVLSVQAVPMTLLFFTMAIAAIGISINRAMRRFLSAIWGKVALSNLGEPMVLLSTDKVHVGDSFTVIYHQKIRRQVDIKRLTIRLIQRTHTVKRRDVYGFQDTKARKHDRVVQVKQRNGQQYKTEAVFHREVSFTIPTGETPTLETVGRREEWLLLVHLAVSHKIPYQEEYAFQVLAERNTV
jgi:hypothetical protein